MLFRSRQQLNKVRLRWYLQDPDGPASKANSIVKEYVELLPQVMMASFQTYEKARTEFGWDPHNHPVSAWSGPAGALLSALQNMQWPDWPGSFRPTWARNGKQPQPFELLSDFCSLVAAAEIDSGKEASNEAA